MEAATKFTLDVSSEEAAKLRAAVKDKLSELIGDDTDNVLVEYVVVLVSHGKQQSQAIVDLEAFLGIESKAFVTWLWDHFITNKHSYMPAKEDTHLSMDADEDTHLDMETEPETKQLNGHGGRTLASVIAVNEGATAVFDTETKEGALEGTTSESQPEVSDHSTKRGQCREKSLLSESKRVRSPEIWTRKGRGRPDTIEMSPPDVKASRRLLISAVREAVAGSALPASTKSATTQKAESALKHLPSMVSTYVDAQERDIKMVDANANIHNMQVPDVSLETQIQQRPSSVWDRLGVNNNERLGNGKLLGQVAGDDDMGGEETHEVSSDGTRIDARYSEYAPRWRKVPERKNRNGRMEHVYLGGKHQNFKSRLEEENGQLQGSTPDTGLEQGLPLRTDIYSRNQMWVHRHPLERYNPACDAHGMNDNGIIAKRELVQADDGKDVVEMKKRLRQVQLEMTKLRARQAEVSKEVQNTPVSGLATGVRPLLIQPNQEESNARSIFVSNVHFAATKVTLNVHFGDCGEIVRITLLDDAVTGKPKGSAYVEFSTKEAAEKALALDGSSLLSRTLKVVRKDAAAVEMRTLQTVHVPMQRPPHHCPFARDSGLVRRNRHTLQRPAGMGKSFLGGTSHLQWKRAESPLTGAHPTVDAVATAVGERFAHGPVRITRSLSYVRVAPYAMH